MNYSGVVGVITDLIAVSALVPLALLIYFYGTVRVPGKFFRKWSTQYWRSSDIGKTQMYTWLAWFVFLTFVLASLFFPDFMFRDEIRIGIYIAIVSLFWRSLYVLRRVQKDPTSDRISRRNKR